MAIIPIWKDYPIDIRTNEPYVDYSIKLIPPGQPIYSGRAYKLPGATSVRIVPNEICAPYLTRSELNIPYTGADQGMAQSFSLSTSLPGYEAIVFTFTADYSYQYSALPVSNDPIVGVLGRRSIAFVSVYNHLYKYPGTPLNWVVTFRGPNVADQDLTITINNPSRSMAFPWSTLSPKYDRVIAHNPAGDVEYRFVDSCAQYTLYYINAYGAWDGLLVDGMVKQTDDYTRTTFKQAYTTDNTVLRQPRGTVNLQNDITRKYSFVTGWLTDDQASRMHHLLGSVNVVLHDNVAAKYWPVVLTNSSCEYKTYRNQGAKLVNYTIEATIAQNFTRR